MSTSRRSVLGATALAATGLAAPLGRATEVAENDPTPAGASGAPPNGAPQSNVDFRSSLIKPPTLLSSPPIKGAAENEITPPGRKPILRDPDAINAIQARFKTLFPDFASINATSSHLPKDTKSAALHRIDKNFFFQRHDEDAGFHYNQCESLLNQSADLLDRSISYRNEWDDKSAKSALLGLELATFFQNEQVHQDEIAQGLFTLPYEMSDQELNAQNAIAAASTTSAGILTNQLNTRWDQGSLSLQTQYQNIMEYLTKVPSYQEQVNFIWPSYSFTVSSGQTFSGDNKAIAVAITPIQYQWSLSNQYDILNTQAINTKMTSDVASTRGVAYTKKAAYDQADIDFKRRRSEIAISLADLKSKFSTDAGGALNYVEQMGSIKTLFTRDFRDAVARLVSAEHGLTTIYNYPYRLPPELRAGLVAGSGDLGAEALDSAVNWVRNAIAWLIPFTDSDDTYCLSFSLKELTKPNWDHYRDAGIWQFTVDETFLPRQAHVRLRGAEPFVHDGENDYGTWSAAVVAPQASHYLYLNNKTSNVNQPMTEVRAGRIGERKNNQAFDVIGRSSLHNFSPLGKWQVSLSANSTSGTRRHEVENLILDLNLAVRYVPQSR